MALKVGELFASFCIDSSDLDSSMNQITRQCNNIGSSMMQAGVGLSAAVTAPIVKAAKDMYTAGTDFEAQMSKVQAIAGLDSQIAADAAAIEALTQQALYMGSTTEWTATQAGEALEYMAMAGWVDEAMLAGLESVMHLATAAGSDLGTTSDIVTDAMTAFGLTLQSAGGDTKVFTGYVEHFTDVLAAAATSSNTNVELLGTSFRYVAPLAGTLGQSVDDVAVALGLMANSGIKSTMAGAALRNILNGLMGTTESTAEACATLGASLYDERGQAKDLMTVMQELRGSYKANATEVAAMQKACAELDTQFAEGKITQEQYEAAIDEITAGCSDFMAACVKLAGKQGLSGLLAIMAASDEDFDNLAKAIANCDGATAQMAATMLANARGAVTIFKSSIEGLEITLWTLISGSFTATVNKATEVVQSFQQMDRATQLTIMKFMGLAAAAGPVLLACGKLVKMLPAIVSGIAALASPVGIVTAGLALFAVAAIDADNTLGRLFTRTTKKAKKSLQELNKTITASMRSISSRMGALCKSIVEGLHDIIPEAMETITLILEGFMNAISDNAASIAEIGKTIITDLLGGISSALPRLIPAAASMVTSIAAALIENIPSLVSAAGNLMSAFVEGIQNTDWISLGTKILDAVKNSISGLTKVFNDWFANAASFASSLDWASIGTQFIDMIVDGIKSASDVAATIVDAIGSLFTAEGAGTKFMAGATTIATALINAIVDAIPSLTDLAKGIVEAIGNALSMIDWSAAIDNVTTLGSALVDAIVAGIKGLGEVGVSIVEAVGNVLGNINWDSVSVSLNGFADMLLNGIKKGIQALTQMDVGIYTALGNLFGKIDWSTVSNVTDSLATTLINGITEGLKANVRGAAQVLGAISDMLGKIDWSKLGDTVGSLAQTLFDGIAEGAKTLVPDLSELISAIGRGIEAAAGSLGELAGSLIGNIVKFVLSPDNWLKLIQLGGEIVNGIATGIENLADSILTGAWNAVVGVFNGLFQSLGITVSDEAKAALNSTAEVIGTEGDVIIASVSSIFSHLRSIGSVIGGVFDEASLNSYISAYNACLATGQAEIIASIEEYSFLGNQAIVSLFQLLVDTSASEAARASALISLNSLGLGDYISHEFKIANAGVVAAAQAMSDDAVAAFVTAFTVLGYIIPDAVRAGLEAGTINVEQAAAQVVAAASTANEQANAEAAAAATGTGVTDSLSDAEDAGAPNVQTSSEGVVDAATIALETLPDVAAIVGEDTASGMADGIDNNAGLVTSAMDTLSSDVVNAAIAKMTYETGYKTGYDYVNAMNAGISAASSAVVSSVTRAANSVKGAAMNILTSVAGSSIGSNFARGIASGISAGRSAIVNAAVSVANAAVSAAKSTLDINSPSRVARDEIGLMYDAGIVAGLRKGLTDVQHAAFAISRSLHDSFYVDDTSRGTVYTSQQQAAANARQVAEANHTGSMIERAKAIGRAIADRIIESGALNSDIYMDEDKVGQKVAQPVSSTISKKTKETVTGRSLQGVIA